MLKIVDALIPQGKPRKSYSGDNEVPVSVFQLSELTATGKGLDNGKALGPDNISNELLKIIVLKRPELILNLFNTCLTNGAFSDQWKRQKLVLISKGNGRDSSAPFLYRPLGILDTEGKLCKQTILNRMQTILDSSEDNGLSQMQYVFRVGGSYCMLSWKCRMV